AKLTGEIVVRRARPGETLTTIDHAVRTLDADDMVVADETGAVALAGVMGGADTEIADDTVDVLLEAPWCDPPSIARAVRRNKLPREASRRVERGIVPESAVPALRRAAELLAEYGGATIGALTVVGDPFEPVTVELPVDLPGRIIGVPLDEAAVVAHLEKIGCTVTPGDRLQVRPPSWRPDLRDPYDLAEEVARLVGYEHIPELVPVPPTVGRGLTERQRFRRRMGRALAYRGYVEAISHPWTSGEDADALGLADDDPRRTAVEVVNPMSGEQPLLRTTLLPGLFRALRRNVGRGSTDVALFESGAVFLPRADAPTEVELPRR